MSEGFVLRSVNSEPAYRAAGQGRRLKMWRPPSSGPNRVTLEGLDTILRRARDGARNDPWIGAALDKLTSNGIGTGIHCKPLWGDDALKASIKREWDSWTKHSDADGISDWYGQQGLAWRSWKEAGEVFARLRVRRLDDGLRVPLQVQLIEAEQCPASLYSTASNGNAVRAGIEFNAIGQRQAYWMYREHPGDNQSRPNGTELVRVPADQVLHIYEPLRPGQLRGIPRAQSILIRAMNADKLDDAVLERHKIANLFTLFYTSATSPELEPRSGMVDEMTAGTDDDGTPLAGLEPGTGQELPPGMKPEFSNPPQAGTDYAEFIRGHLMAIASRLGVPFEVLTGDLRNVSDRALRLILNEFKRLLEMWQWLWFIPQLCQPVREAWFDMAVLHGRLDIPGYADLREQVVETLWVPMGWPYSHPVQDVTADIKAIRGGLASRTGINLARGEDSEQIDTEQAEDNQRADEKGLVYDTDPRKVSNAGLTQARAPGSTLPDTDRGDSEDE